MKTRSSKFLYLAGMDDPGKPFDRLVSLEAAKPSIESGWVLQYRGTGLVSRVIQVVTGSPHSHSAMCVRMPSGEIDVLELREFVGGRRRSIEWHTEKFPGVIDCFSPNSLGCWGTRYDADKAAAMMRWLCDGDYGYLGVAKLLLRRVPGFWRLVGQSNDEVELADSQPFCSHAVALATMAGGVDPVPYLPSCEVTPGMLTRSLFFEYQFTISG